MLTTTTAVPDAAGIAPEPLARSRDFKVVLVGQGVSSFGDAITNTALPLLVLALTGSGFAMGIVGALSTLPDLLIGLPAGAYADRWDRRRMMFVADLGRAVITVAVPLTYWLGGPTMAVILLITFPLNVLRVLWLAAYTAAVPGLVGRPQIARANAIFESFFTVGWIAGPALAGILSAAIGPASTLAIDAITFVFSSAALLFVRRPLRPPPRAERPHLLSDIREGVRYVAGHPTLRAVGYITLRTALSPDAMLGRIGSTARTISVGLMPIGSFAGGAMIDLTNGGVTLATMGALLLVASGAFALMPNLRRARVPRPGKRAIA